MRDPSDQWGPGLDKRASLAQPLCKVGSPKPGMQPILAYLHAPPATILNVFFNFSKR